MLNDLKIIRRRFIALIITGLVIAPLAGLATALLFGSITRQDLQNTDTLLILAGFVVTVSGLGYLHFTRYFSNLPKISRHNLLSGELPDLQQQQLARFTRDYWCFFLYYPLVTPALFFLAAGIPTTSWPSTRLANWRNTSPC
jgi:uncharacterized RDD family membrane protein YckC